MRRTSVAHLVNGSVIDITKVTASPDYVALLTRLVDAPTPTPLTSLEVWRRYVNKKLGKPATPDVGVLSDMLVSLRDETVSALSPSSRPSFHLDYIVITRPPLSGLRKEDLSDALERAGLRSWLDPPEHRQAGMYPTALGEAQAVFAANGNGLCVDYKNLFMCGDEEEHMSSHVVLAASFTQHALYIAAGVLRAPFHWVPPALVHATDLDAGLGSMEEYASQDEFWARVRNRLGDVARQGLVRTKGRLTDVLLMGENATHPDFLRALQDSLADLTESKSSGVETIRETVFADPTFAGARGAALYARWRQESPFGCRDSAKCEEKRRRERVTHTWDSGRDQGNHNQVPLAQTL